MPTPEPGSEVAAIDLGSNSFHMIVARLDADGVHIQDRLRERVALAEGLVDKRLTQEAQDRAIACLQRFGQRLDGLPQSSVRAVGTNTLRKAENSRSFLVRAAEALGHPIEVISGQEEARIIYLGVLHDLPDSPPHKLVVDIGGGSTEFILGRGEETLQRDSIGMGCVGWKQRFFAEGVIDRDAMDRAHVAARLAMRARERTYRRAGWDAAIGASGTIKSVEAILRANEWSDRGITRTGLESLREALIAAGSVESLRLPGLDPDRRTVLASGVAVLRAVFEGLRIEEMRVAQSALREGLLYDLRGRIHEEDVREATIRRFQERYGVDTAHAERVGRTALDLFREGAKGWGLKNSRNRLYLRWAAQLHEIGQSVSHSGYHKHGAYLLRNATMPGFSRDDQEMLAALVLSQRRKVTRERLEVYLPGKPAADALRLGVFLRLAVRIHRPRSGTRQPEVTLSVAGDTVHLGFPGGWLDTHALTRADLQDEQAILAVAGITLRVD